MSAYLVSIGPIDQTRWPDAETVDDWTQGAPLAKVKALIDHWRHRYDWRRCEAMLNDWCQYKTSIDGLGIHFLHVRSKHKNALPLIITHGWPGSGFSRALIGAVKVKRKEESHD
jgi:epoxide hydrolase